MYKNILIAIDGSEIANRALKHGVALAASVGASVTVVTVSEMWSPAYTDYARQRSSDKTNETFKSVEAFTSMEDERAGRILATAEEQVKSKGVVCNILHINDQLPADGILVAAMVSESDLIVMSSHGRRGIKRVLMGSVAVEVLTLSNVPVLIIR